MLEPLGKNRFVINGIPADLEEGNSVEVLERIIENHKKHLKDINGINLFKYLMKPL